jgi:hypothetical protein
MNLRQKKVCGIHRANRTPAIRVNAEMSPSNPIAIHSSVLAFIIQCTCSCAGDAADEHVPASAEDTQRDQRGDDRDYPRQETASSRPSSACECDECGTDSEVEAPSFRIYAIGG